MYKNRGKEEQNFFKNSCSFILRTRKSSRKQCWKIQNIHAILNFPALDFLICKIKEQEFLKKICRSLPLFLYIPDNPNARDNGGRTPIYYASCQTDFLWFLRSAASKTFPLIALSFVKQMSMV